MRSTVSLASEPEPVKNTWFIPAGAMSAIALASATAGG